MPKLFIRRNSCHSLLEVLSWISSMYCGYYAHSALVIHPFPGTGTVKISVHQFCLYWRMCNMLEKWEHLHPFPAENESWVRMAHITIMSWNRWGVHATSLINWLVSLICKKWMKLSSCHVCYSLLILYVLFLMHSNLAHGDACWVLLSVMQWWSCFKQQKPA